MHLFFWMEGAATLAIGTHPAAKGPTRSGVLQFFDDRWYT